MTTGGIGKDFNTVKAHKNVGPADKSVIMRTTVQNKYIRGRGEELLTEFDTDYCIFCGNYRISKRYIGLNKSARNLSPLNICEQLTCPVTILII